MNNRRLASFNLTNDSKMFDSPVSKNFQSKHSFMSETLNFSRMSTTFNSFNQISGIHEQSSERTLTPHRINDSSYKSNNFASFSKTLQFLNESEDESAIEEEISKLVIFESFFQVSKRHNNSSDALHLLSEFDQTCDDNLIVSSEMLGNKLRTDAETKYLERFSKLVRSERDTWKLFRMLYLDRIEVQGAEREAADEMDIDEESRIRLHDAGLATLNLQRNASLREIQIIVQWLEEINDEKLDFGNDVVIDSQMYWETTFTQLTGSLPSTGGMISSNQFGSHLSLASTNSLSAQKSQDLCQEMDPDAPMRTGMRIADNDKEDENRLFHCMFRLIRRGRVGEAQEIAEKAGFWWLSSALDGYKLYNDPNYVENSDNIDENGHEQCPEYSSAVKELSVQTGNPLRDLWKQHAWNFAKVAGNNLYERALFAVFSGNRKILLPLCNGWKDRLWAYFRCSLEVNFEKIFRESAIDKPDLMPRTCDEFPEEFWENLLSAEEIFNNLVENEVGNEEDYHREIVKLLILGRINDLVTLIYKWTEKIRSERANRRSHSGNLSMNLSLHASEEVQDKAKVVEPNLLRFFAHVVIAILQLKLITEPEMNENCLSIIEAYTEYLVEYKLIQLVAHYSQFLPPERQVKAFSSLLETIDNEDDRQLCMAVAKQSQMNLPVLLSTVVENIQNNANVSCPEITMGGDENCQDEQDSVMRSMSRKSANLLTPQITNEDLKRVNALNWLLLDKENPQYVELLKQVNVLIRTFLLDQKGDLAKETLENMPLDLIEKSYSQWKSIRASINQSQVDASSNLSDDGSIETMSLADIDIENTAREYICHKVFFDAKEAFDNWHRCLYQEKPIEPTEPKQMSKVAERVVHEQALREYEQSRRSWLADLEQEAETAWEKIVTFLQFPDNIWRDVEGLNNFEKFAFASEDVNDNKKGAKKSELAFLNAVLAADHKNGERMSVASSVFSEANAIQTFESALKRTDARLPELPSLSNTSRAQQFANLRRIYINQYLILLSTIIRESQQSPKLIYEKIVEILNIAETAEFDDVITQGQMKDLIIKLHHCLKN